MSFSFSKLKSGSLVEINVTNDQNKLIKLKTIVENVVSLDEMVLLAPVHQGVNYPLRTNQSFSLIMVNKHTELDQYDIYSCTCKIVERMQVNKISTIRIKRTGDINQVQRRDYFRLPLIKNMTILYDNRIYGMLSKDLSGNGFKGYVDLKLPADSEGVLQLDTGEEKLSLRFKVIDCLQDPEHSRRYELRASFLQIKGSQRSKLLKYIYAKQSEGIRKQIELKNTSILGTYQSYGDYFDMPTKEKISRIAPIILWALTLINLAYFTMAFKNLDMGLNRFFKAFQRDFRPEFLNVSTSISAILILSSLVAISLNESNNTRTKSRVRIHLILIFLLGAGILTASLLLGSGNLGQ